MGFLKVYHLVDSFSLFRELYVPLNDNFLAMCVPYHCQAICFLIAQLYVAPHYSAVYIPSMFSYVCTPSLHNYVCTPSLHSYVCTPSLLS